jgi:hypothetical protein
MSDAPPPLRSTLLPLLETLANQALRSRPGGPPIKVRRIDLHPEGADLHLSLPAEVPLPQGTYRLRLRVETTGPERTVCAVELPDTPALGRMMGLGLKRLPSRLLQPLLERLLGEGVRLEGDRLILEHRALLRQKLKPD